MKIVQQLNLEGYLVATRGKNGGLKLNNEPSEINIGTLVPGIEDKSKLVECFGSYLIDNYNHVISLAALFWVVAYGCFIALYLPILTRPKA